MRQQPAHRRNFQLHFRQCQRILHRSCGDHFAVCHQIRAFTPYNYNTCLLQNLCHDKRALLARRVSIAPGVIQNELDIWRIPHGSQETLFTNSGSGSFFAASRDDDNSAFSDHWYWREEKVRGSPACLVKVGIFRETDPANGNIVLMWNGDFVDGFGKCDQFLESLVRLACLNTKDSLIIIQDDIYNKG